MRFHPDVRCLGSHMAIVSVVFYRVDEQACFR